MIAFMGGQGAKAGSIAYTENGTPTLRATESGSNQVPDVVYQNTGIGWWNESKVAETLRTPCGGDSTKANLAVFCLQGNGIDRAETAGCNGAGWKENIGYTLNTIDRHAVCYTIDGSNAVLNTEKSGTLQAKPNGGFSHNFINPVVCRGFDMKAFGQYGNGEKGSTLKHRDYKDNTDLCVESARPPRKWIVRRLTPTECARLQGFPDEWGHPDKKDHFTQEEYRFWLDVRNTHAAINGRAVKDYTEEQMLAWYNKLHTDSAEYKMWGNGIALPCAAFVMQGIAKIAREGKA